jgi:hypothetical protein
MEGGGGGNRAPARGGRQGSVTDTDHPEPAEPGASQRPSSRSLLARLGFDSTKPLCRRCASALRVLSTSVAVRRSDFGDALAKLFAGIAEHYRQRLRDFSV